MKVGWKFWLLGTVVVVGFEVFRILALLSLGYVWVPFGEEVSPAYIFGGLLGYFFMVAIIACVSAWIWEKTHKKVKPPI